MPTSRGGRAGLGPPVGGVVVGQREHVEPGVRGRAHQLLRASACRRWPASGCGGRCARSTARRRPGRLESRRGSSPDRRGAPERHLHQRRPQPDTSRRIQSSRSSRTAEAGRSTIHSQRPAASPATTVRSRSPRASLVETGHSGTDWLSIADLHRRRAVADLRPGVVGDGCRRTARRARSRPPRRPRTRRPGRRARWCPTRRSSWPAGRPVRPATTPKSVTAQPGLIGQGRYVGKPSATCRWSVKPS